MPNGVGHACSAAGLDRIEAFVSGYHIAHLDRSPTAEERRIISDALVRYLLGEEWLIGRAKLRAAAALHALAAIKQRLPPIARPTAKLVELCIIDLAGWLDNQEDDNLIMREHLVMMSEQIRQLRRVAPTPLSEI